LLEVREGTQKRLVRKTHERRDRSRSDDPQLQVYDEKGNRNSCATTAGTIHAGAARPALAETVDVLETVRSGPQYRVIPFRDSVILPGHARHKDDIWGYGKKFTKRMPEIQNARRGWVYDAEAVPASRRPATPRRITALQRSGQAVAPQEGPTAEKELWEVLVLHDLDGRGERWYLATIHLGQQILLRLQHDDLDRSRFVVFILFPRPDRATEGFSCIGHKLITTIEEHTAWRNMIADRAAMVVQAPIKRLTGALWDPLEQPFGPSAVIDVRDMRKSKRCRCRTSPRPPSNANAAMERTAERLMGVNDIASGQTLNETKTLGEVQMATEQSFVRMDLVIGASRSRWRTCSRSAMRFASGCCRSRKGIEAPQSVMTGLEARGTRPGVGKIGRAGLGRRRSAASRGAPSRRRIRRRSATT
jgi:hypothetical protein